MQSCYKSPTLFGEHEVGRDLATKSKVRWSSEILATLGSGRLVQKSEQVQGAAREKKMFTSG